MAMKRNVEASKTEFDTAINEAGAKTQEVTKGIPKKGATKPVEKVTVAKTIPDVKEEKPVETAVVVGGEKSVIAQQRQMVNVFSDIENQFIADYGMLPRIKASNGNCMDGDDKILGSEIEIQVLSWNRQYVAGPCDNDAPTELVKYSFDKEVFDDGTGRLDTYIADLKDAGWAEACVKEYYGIVAVLLKSEKPSEHVGEMVLLQLSPTSVKSFNGFRLQAGFKIARGLLPAGSLDTVIVNAEVVSAKGNTWTKFSFRPKINVG